MGATISSISQWPTGRLFSDPEVKVAMVGLDAAGKTTILYRLLGHQYSADIPTYGVNFETFRHQGTDFAVTDFAGGRNVRAMRDSVSGVQDIIFVVDCADHKRLDEARNELYNNVLNVAVEGTEKRALLVFANKQDLPNALSSAELAEQLGMHELKVDRWHVQPSCGTTGAGLIEGLNWLAQDVDRSH